MEGSNGEWVDNLEVEQRLWRFEPVIFQQLLPKMKPHMKRFVCNLNDKNYNYYDNLTLSIEDVDTDDLPFEKFIKIPIEVRCPRD